MIKSNVLSAWRNSIAHPVPTTLNLMGLSVGLACALYIVLFVRNELSYDRWIPNSENIAAVHMLLEAPGRPSFNTVLASGPMAEAFVEQYPDVTAATRVFLISTSVRRANDTVFSEELAYADANFFDLFALPFIVGDPSTALAGGNSVVLSRDYATKYFGRTDVIGETLTLDSSRDVIVTGVFENLPEETHLKLDAITPFIREQFLDQPWYAESWVAANAHTYLKIRPGADIQVVADDMPDFIRRNVPLVQFGDQEVQPSDFMTLEIVPVRDLHLRTADKTYHMNAPGDVKTIYTFSAIALLLVIVACINYVNLATARSLQRSREIALRKVMGATRTQLVRQLIIESVFTVIVAVIGAYILAAFLLPLYENLIGKTINLSSLFSGDLLVASFLIAILIGILAGLYPATTMAATGAASGLRAAQSSSTGSGARVRSILVVFQFAITIALIVGTAIVYVQTHYLRNLDPGYDRQNVLVIRGTGHRSIEPMQESLRNRIERLPGIKTVAYGAEVPLDGAESNMPVTIPGRQSDGLIVLGRKIIDFDYPETLGLRLLEGRLLADEYGGDRLRYDPSDVHGTISERVAVLVNEKAVQNFGLANPAEAIGFRFRGDPIPGSGDSQVDFEIVGVVADHHEKTAKIGMRPLAFIHDRHRFDLLIAKYDGSAKDAIIQTEKIWSDLAPDRPFFAETLEEKVAEQYRSDELRGRLLATFSVVAIAVACLGMFGLALFVAARRTKEIAIRKTLGATSLDIVQLLLWHFSKPVVVANLIAWPVAFIAAQEWLSGFVYRVSINPLIFVASSVLALLIAWLTVGLHTTKVASTKPGLVLHYE